MNVSRLVNRFEHRSKLLLAAALLPLAVACSDGSDGSGAVGPTYTGPFAELLEQGIARYLGLYTPMVSEADGDVVSHTFGTGSGPLCGEGLPYTMYTRDQGSQELMIFLEGGGACWSDFCFYITDPEPGIRSLGILDPERGNNPVKDWNHVYLPYCDGSLHVGDRDIDTDDDGENDRFQRGLHNLSASLDVAVNAFPAPSRIVLAGQSGGGLGTIFALPLVRYMYPGVPIEVVNDSGVGVGRIDKPEFLEQLTQEWNLSAFIPASCPDCIAEDGHLSDYLIWQLDQDPNVRRSYLGYTGDSTLANTFLRIGGASYEQAIIAEMAQQEAAHPERVRSWLKAGMQHTFITDDPDVTVQGVSAMDWINAMLTDSADWVSLLEE